MATPKSARVIVVAQWVVVVGAALKAAVSVFRIIATSAPDFFYYYEAAGEVIRNVPRPIHLLPPASLLVFSPLALLPYEIMEALWILGSFASLVGIVWFLARQSGVTDTRTTLTLVALSYLSFPSQFTLGMGQVNFYALALIIGAIYYENKYHRLVMGGLFALAVLIKPEVILLLAVLLAYRRWTTLLSVGAWMAGVGIASLGVYGFDAYVRYAERMQKAMGTWQDHGIYYNQGITGLLARMGTTDVISYAIIAGIIITVTASAFRKNKIRFPEALWLAMPVFLLVEPIAWQHHFVFLIPTFFVLWKRNEKKMFRGLLVLGYLLISANVASPGFFTGLPFGWIPASHGTIGAIILWLVSIF
ncbi:MAG: glycosyltransferase family 87 protein [Patescibacteria group bacterium]